MTSNHLSPSGGAKLELSALERIKAILAEISDPQEREIAEAKLLNEFASYIPEREQIVVLIHGMNTDAEWQEALADQLRRDYGITTYPIGYGNFRPWRFLCPVLTREKPISVVTRELRNIRTMYPNAYISVIAHSFGTYILSKILDDATDLVFHRIQLCGAVVDTNFRWDKVKPRFADQIVNDVGSKDFWPMIARMVTWGYGDSGTFGFKKANVRDRHFNYGHSDFMTPEHVREYWTPLLVDGQIIPSAWTEKRRRPGWFISLIRLLPLKLLWIVVPLLILWSFGLLPRLAGLIK